MSPVLHAPATLETTLQCERNTRLETREQIQEAEHDLEVNHGSLEDEEAPGDGSALRQRRLDFFERRERSESRGSSSAEELNPDAPLERSREGEQNESIAAATDGFPIRLKYLNDTERCVRGRPDETVGSFKRSVNKFSIAMLQIRSHSVHIAFQSVKGICTRTKLHGTIRCHHTTTTARCVR